MSIQNDNEKENINKPLDDSELTDVTGGTLPEVLIEKGYRECPYCHGPVIQSNNYCVSCKRTIFF